MYKLRIMRNLFNYLAHDVLAYLDNVARTYRMARCFESLKDAVHMDSSHGDSNICR